MFREKSAEGSRTCGPAPAVAASCMGWRALGDSAWLYEPGGMDSAGRYRRALGMLESLRNHSIPGITGRVASFESVAVHFDPADGRDILEALTRLPVPAGEAGVTDGRKVEIPVCYGPRNAGDLAELARHIAMDPDEVIAIHHGTEYTVASIGFSPGFPYLTGLDPRLHLPRKAAPRPVERGSVAIAGGQAGIYPFDSPGGWHVLGKTSVPLFDVSRDPPALLRAGDRVRFVPVASLPVDEIGNGTAVRTPARGAIEILDPGPFTTVQDLGRPGWQESGVTPGGAADPVSARVANRLVGNPDEAALLECAHGGPVLRFHQPTTVAAVGWDMPDRGRPLAFAAGETLDLRRRMSMQFGYLAIAGGLDVPQVLGSRSTDVRSGFGGFAGRALRSGDRLGSFDPHSRPPAMTDRRVDWPRARTRLEVRYLPGMQASWFPPETKKTFQAGIYQIGSRRDRTGARLDGPLLMRSGDREMVSQPVVRGSIQVPPDGKPILLLSECQTIGGYPQIGHVISADIPALARALPGTPLRFVEVGLEEARAAWREHQRDLALLQTGIDLLT